MTSVPFPPSERLESTPASRRRALVSAAGSVVLAVLSVYVVVYLLRRDVIPVDFHVYRQAAEEIADGDSPYPWFAYPPLSAPPGAGGSGHPCSVPELLRTTGY